MLSAGLTAAAIGVLGLVLAGSLAIAGPQASGVDRSDAGRPDASRAEPAGLSVNDDTSQGHSEDQQDQDGTGTLDGFDRRRQTSGRDAVREQLDQARTNKKSQERGSDLDEQRRKATERQQDEASKDRSGDLDEARRAAEEERLRRERELAGNGRLNTPPPPPDDSDLNSGPATSPLRSGTYVYGARFGQYGVWARYHTGQDFPARIGTPIYAVKDGVVVSSPGGWAGISVGLRHAGGDGTLYAHMSRRVVSVGQTVQAGQIIGYVGVTGNTSGPHLHFEYYPPGTQIGDVYRAQNPLAWLRGQNVPV